MAEGFVIAVESAATGLAATLERWRVVEKPEIRRCVFNRFPFISYYRWEPKHERSHLRGHAQQPGTRLLAASRRARRLEIS